MTSFWEILKSSKNLKASDAFAELWGKSIADSWDIITITGSLPLSFLSKGEALTNYRLYGTSEGAGVQTSGTEPAGYQIPLMVTSGVTENLFDKDNLNIVKAYINSNNAIVSYNTNGLIYVPVATGETYTISGFKRNLSTIDIKWGITASIPENGVSCTRTGLLNQSSSLTVNIASGEKYVCIFLCGDSDYTQYGSVEQAIMKNVETGMIVLGSTAPDHYIPHRYTADYNLYIGNTKLGAEEYLDYQEQKVYKRTANLFDKDAAYQVSAIANNYTLSGLDPAKSYTCSTTLDKPSGATAASIYFSLTTSATAANNGVWSDKTVTLTPNQDGTILVNTRHTAAGGAPAVSDDVINGTIKIMVNEGSTALPYIPYLQPTDPPAPFPAITAYKGENTLSSTETVGEVSVTGKIKEI